MPTDDNQIFYETTSRFDANRIRAAAVYCSDGRFGDPFDELMQNALKLPRYDRLAVPGARPAWPAISRPIGKKKVLPSS